MASLRNLKKDLNYLADDLRALISVKVFIENANVDTASTAVEKLNEYQQGLLSDMQAGRRLKEAGRRATAKSRREALNGVRKSMLEGYDKLAEEISQLK